MDRILQFYAKDAKNKKSGFHFLLSLVNSNHKVLVYTRNTAYKLILFGFGHKGVQIGAYTEPTSLALKNSFLILLCFVFSKVD